MRVILIPALQDNYQYLIICNKTRLAAVVDPADADSVMQAAKNAQVKLAAVLNTHHHWDHTGGNRQLVQELAIPVYCSDYDRDRVPQADHFLSEGDGVSIGALQFQVMEVPGHTLGHIAYYGHAALFCGDTLFACGCGRLFEGTPEQMLQSLRKLAALPPQTRVYCGHEYTLNNLLFAKILESGNQALSAKLSEARMLRAQKKPTVPTLLGEELSYNPFLRVDSREILQALEQKGFGKLQNGIERFAAIRHFKDQF